MPSDTTFEKLTDENYSEWKVYMEALLVRKDLLDYVDGTKRHPGGNEGTAKVHAFYLKQAKARAEIILRVTPSQLSHCRDSDPAAIWNSLMNVHASRGRSTIIALRRHFHRLCFNRSETMSTYIARVRGVAFLLEEANVTVSHDDLILAITSGLPSAYDSFLVALDATPDSEYTLELVIFRLVNEYQCQISSYPPRSAASAPAHADEAMAVMPIKRTNLAHITCYRCGNKGHYQANCPIPPPNSSTSTGSNSGNIETAAAAFAEDDNDSEFSCAF